MPRSQPKSISLDIRDEVWRWWLAISKSAQIPLSPNEPETDNVNRTIVDDAQRRYLRPRSAAVPLIRARNGKGVNAAEPVGFLPAQFPQNSSEWSNSRSFPANSGHVTPLFRAGMAASD
jgi:hypothetical protein